MKIKPSGMKSVAGDESRLMSLLASLVFSVPTVFLLWLGFKLDGVYFWVLIGIFAFLAMVVPGLFPAIMGYIWQALVRMQKWLTW